MHATNTNDSRHQRCCVPATCWAKGTGTGEEGGRDHVLKLLETDVGQVPPPCSCSSQAQASNTVPGAYLIVDDAAGWKDGRYEGAPT